MGLFDSMPPVWNEEGMPQDEAAVPGAKPTPQPNGDPSKIKSDPTDDGLAELYASTFLPKDPNAVVPPPEDPTVGANGPSLFSRVSGKYADLAKAGAIGGPKPASSGSAREDSEDSDDSDASASPETAQKDYIKDLLGKIYGKDLTDDALKAAMAKRDSMHKDALMSKAGIQLGAALSRGAIKPDYTVQDELMKQAGQGVQDILTRRSAKMQEMEAGLKASDLMDHEKLRDPNSSVSAAYRDMALQLNPKLAENDDFTQMSAEGVKQLMPMVDMSIRAQMAKDSHQMMQMQKIQMDQAKAKAEMSTKIATVLTRGANAKAADVDRRVDNALSIVNDPRWANNLNKMPEDQVNALRDEMTQIFTGGMSTEGKAAKIMSPTLASGLSKFLRDTSNKPTGAQMGAFIQNYKPYLADLQSNSRGYIRDQIHPIMTGYNKRVAPGDMDEYAETLSKYLNPNPNAKMPKVGEIVDGHRFKGGDPSAKESWEEAQ